MKMKIFALICVIAISVLAFAACGGGKTEDCEHTFSEAWASDAANHWHQATCEHGEIKDSLGAHTDANEDSKCDVCEYEVGHTHTYESEWSFNEEKHWLASTCSHADEKKDFDLHSDEDDNGECDVCKGHVHNINGAGYCKHESCGEKLKEVDESSLEAIVNALLVQSKYVNGVNIGYIFDGPSDNEDYWNDMSGQYESYNSHVEKQINIVFGRNNYVYNNTVTNNRVGYQISETEYSLGYKTGTGTFESWVQLMGPERIFGVYTEDGGALQASTNDMDKLLGYYYTASTFADAHGTENFLYAIYEATLLDDVFDLTVTIDAETNSVSFTFGLLVVHATQTSPNGGGGSIDTDAVVEYETIYNATYFDVAVSFGYTDDFVLTSFDLDCKTYTNDAGALFNGNTNVKDVSIQYDPETHTFKFVEYDEALGQYVETDTPDYNTYTYTITQTVGERTAENENPQSKFVPESFKIYTDEARTQELGKSFSMIHGVGKYLYFGGYSPVGTSLDFAPELITYQIIDSNGNVLNNTDAMNLPVDEEGNQVALSEDFRSFYSFNEAGRLMYVMPKTAGTYTIAIYYQGELAYQLSLTAR